MTIAQSGTVKVHNATINTTTNTVTFDSVPSDGDLIILFGHGPGASTPTGFTNAGVIGDGDVWYRVASGEGSAAYAVTHSNDEYVLVGRVFTKAAGNTWSRVGATVVIEVAMASTPADTVGECTAFDSWEQPTAVDSSGRFREKVGSVFSGFVCARARGELNGLTGVSELTKLELRGDGGAVCTPESSLASGELDVVIGS